MVMGPDRKVGQIFGWEVLALVALIAGLLGRVAMDLHPVLAVNTVTIPSRPLMGLQHADVPRFFRNFRTFLGDFDPGELDYRSLGQT